MASKIQFAMIIFTIALLWISCVSSQSCGNGCEDCLMDRYCRTCRDGYYLRNTQCSKCFEGCLKCVNVFFECSHQCKPGSWGKYCMYSCTSCSECVTDLCKENCYDYAESSQCDNGNSVCPNQKCSFRFFGPRKSDKVISTNQTNVPTPFSQTTTTQPTMTSTTTPSTQSRLTTSTTTHGLQTQSTTSQPIPTKSMTKKTSTEHTQTSNLTTKRKTTTFTRQATKKIQSDGMHTERPDKTQALENGTTVQAESQTNGSGIPVLYFVIAVVGVFFLASVIVVVVYIKIRNSRQDQVTCPQDANNKAEPHQLAHNAGENSNVSHHGNAIGNIATINVAESDTGYVGTNAIDTIVNINVAESDTGYEDMSTIDNVAITNVAGSNTGFVYMKAAAYENVVDKTAINASDTVNEYEALNQYTNVRESENQYTSLSGNVSVYYTVVD